MSYRSVHWSTGQLWPEEGDAGSLLRSQVASPGLGSAGHIWVGPSEGHRLGDCRQLDYTGGSYGLGA